MSRICQETADDMAAIVKAAKRKDKLSDAPPSPTSTISSVGFDSGSEPSTPRRELTLDERLDALQRTDRGPVEPVSAAPSLSSLGIFAREAKQDTSVAAVDGVLMQSIRLLPTVSSMKEVTHLTDAMTDFDIHTRKGEFEAAVEKFERAKTLCDQLSHATTWQMSRATDTDDLTTLLGSEEAASDSLDVALTKLGRTITKASTIRKYDEALDTLFNNGDELSHLWDCLDLMDRVMNDTSIAPVKALDTYRVCADLLADFKDELPKYRKALSTIAGSGKKERASAARQAVVALDGLQDVAQLADDLLCKAITKTSTDIVRAELNSVDPSITLDDFPRPAGTVA